MSPIVEVVEITIEDLESGFSDQPRCEFFKLDGPADCECRCLRLAVRRWKALCTRHGARAVWACWDHDELVRSGGELSRCHDGSVILWLPFSA